MFIPAHPHLPQILPGPSSMSIPTPTPNMYEDIYTLSLDWAGQKTEGDWAETREREGWWNSLLKEVGEALLLKWFCTIWHHQGNHGGKSSSCLIAKEQTRLDFTLSSQLKREGAVIKLKRKSCAIKFWISQVRLSAKCRWFKYGQQV